MTPVSTPSLALLDVLVSVDLWLPFSSVLPEFAGLADAVRNASGVIGLAIIAVYSFLIAFVLPLPSEVVLAPVQTGTLALGLPTSLEYAVVIVVSGLGKAAGSVFAFHIGQEAKEAGPIVRFLRRSRFNIVEWSEKTSVELARKYGYVGLAMALSVPFFPDTISIYAFAVLERDYKKFALATFAGSVGRLLVTMGVFGVAFVFL
ncbi:membrane protein YqaA, SNARE-associated domain [Haloarchaeobius iranensis]|uniref:Membrane protein YqaA, SNARE-associated domain n=1 Tax=Haloarchaeobius iranensis TaxID=996166 RepID=A0A1G9T7K3_9EURY|nr:membrane protein YqaA, SNARE-associated domain [Haloarchaeobius iranensis]